MALRERDSYDWTVVPVGVPRDQIEQITYVTPSTTGIYDTAQHVDGTARKFRPKFEGRFGASRIQDRQTPLIVHATIKLKSGETIPLTKRIDVKE